MSSLPLDRTVFSPSTASDAVVAASALSVAAAVIHLGAAMPHVGERPALALAFVATALAQLAVAVVLMRRPDVRANVVAMAVHATAATAWVASRTVGLPLLDVGPEPVAFADLLTVMIELGAVGLLAASLRAALRPRTTAS